MEIDYDYLRTGTAIGFRASRELCSNYLLDDNFPTKKDGPTIFSTTQSLEKMAVASTPFLPRLYRNNCKNNRKMNGIIVSPFMI